MVHFNASRLPNNGFTRSQLLDGSPSSLSASDTQIPTNADIAEANTAPVAASSSPPAAPVERTDFNQYAESTIAPLSLGFPDIAEASERPQTSFPQQESSEIASATEDLPLPQNPLRSTVSPESTELNSASPSLQEIRQGRVLTLGQSGESVKQIQAMLSKAGFKVAATGIFDAATEKQLIAFQKSWGISTTGKMGPTTLKALDTAQLGSSPLGQAIANTARSIAQARNTVGNCYNAVADAVESHVSPFLSGGHAYMSASQFANHPRFREIPRPANMNQLPVGAIVVWAKGNSDSGHISVHLGNGKEASDHVTSQMQSHYGGGRARVFLPL